MPATIAASAAAIAPAAADALPPPGVAVGAASCSTNGSTPARNPPTAIFPPMIACRRFSRISEESKFSICKNHSEAISRAFLGMSPDDLAEGRHHPVARGLAPHELEDARDGRLLKVGEVHRDLRQPAHGEAGGLHVAQSAVREAHGFGDLLGDLDVGGVQINVVRDEELARAHHGSARRRMNPRIAEVRASRRVGGNFFT